jgi:hypothetical protein
MLAGQFCKRNGSGGMRTALTILLAAFGSTANAEMRFYVDGKEVELNTSAATEVFINTMATDFENSCSGYLMMQAALPDLAAATEFPIANNLPPAKDFVAGFLQLDHWGLNMGYRPLSFELIWENIAGDKDKAFSREERDNVVALWSSTTATTPLNCEAK